MLLSLCMCVYVSVCLYLSNINSTWIFFLSSLLYRHYWQIRQKLYEVSLSLDFSTLTTHQLHLKNVCKMHMLVPHPRFIEQESLGNGDQNLCSYGFIKARKDYHRHFHFKSQNRLPILILPNLGHIFEYKYIRVIVCYECWVYFNSVPLQNIFPLPLSLSLSLQNRLRAPRLILLSVLFRYSLPWIHMALSSSSCSATYELDTVI